MELLPLLTGAGALGGLILFAILAPRVWRPVRRLVAVIDALAGRPSRYAGDPEARAGLVERLDLIERHVGNGHTTPLRELVERIAAELAAHLEEHRRVE